MTDRAPRSPLFSIVTPVFDPSPADLDETISSVRSQTCRDWEWVLVDDRSTNPTVRSHLRRAAASDPRISVHERAANGGIVAASNDALERARGRWLVLLGHDDLLDPRALESMAKAIETNPDACYLYSDEDKVGPDGTFAQPFRKPVWSPERLRHQMYLGHLSVIRTDLVRQVGGFRPGFDGSQDHDLALRVTELGEPVVHVPEILYHWRIVPGSTSADPSAKDYASEAGLRAVRDHLDRLGRRGDTVTLAAPHTYRISRVLPPDLMVSVVIPTRGGCGLAWGALRNYVVEAVRSLLAHTEHELLEIVVVHDTGTPRDVLDELSSVCREALVLVAYDKPFNFSDKCNQGFLSAAGDIVVFLNDGIVIQSDHFVEELCAPLWEESVGMTGARLVYPDGTIQHAGHAYFGRDFTHPLLGWPDDDPGPFRALLVDREASGLTAACIAMRRDVFEQVGGFREDLPVNFNDVDLCYKVRGTGRRLVWLADVRATHFESRSRSRDVHVWEHEGVLGRWQQPEVDLYLPCL